jgi:hypothetical protein
MMILIRRCPWRSMTNITKEGVLSMPDGQISTIASFNAHSKLIQILGKIITDGYPTKRMHKDATKEPRAYVANDGNGREVEGSATLGQEPSNAAPARFRLATKACKVAINIAQLF